MLPSLFAEQDGEFRIEILRSIRALILRLRASTHSTFKELEKRTSKLGNVEVELTSILTEAKVFVKWLVGFCRECICPGRSYYTCSMALKTLHVLCEERFFTDLDMEFKSGVLSGVHVELFSPSMLRLLLDRLADGYDEVAELARWLIERIDDPTRIPWKSLYETGRDLCLSRRADKAEGGAKVLCLSQHFSKVNGYTNIWEDVWGSLVGDVQTGDLQSVAEETPLHGRLVALRFSPLCLADLDPSRTMLLLISSIVFINCAVKSGISCLLSSRMILPKVFSSATPQVPPLFAILQLKTSSPVHGVP